MNLTKYYKMNSNLITANKNSSGMQNMLKDCRNNKTIIKDNSGNNIEKDKKAKNKRLSQVKKPKRQNLFNDIDDTEKKPFFELFENEKLKIFQFNDAILVNPINGGDCIFISFIIKNEIIVDVKKEVNLKSPNYKENNVSLIMKEETGDKNDAKLLNEKRKKRNVDDKLVDGTLKYVMLKLKREKKDPYSNEPIIIRKIKQNNHIYKLDKENDNIDRIIIRKINKTQIKQNIISNVIKPIVKIKSIEPKQIDTNRKNLNRSNTSCSSKLKKTNNMKKQVSNEIKEINPKLVATKDVKEVLGSFYDNLMLDEKINKKKEELSEILQVHDVDRIDPSSDFAMNDEKKLCKNY